MTMNFRIERFKCFESVNIPINQLTVFCGANASGKSTIIQSLLLYRASAGLTKKSTISVNSSAGLSLGNAENLLHQRSSDTSDSLKFGFEKNSNKETYDFLELCPLEQENPNHTNSASRSLYIKSTPNAHLIDDKTPFYFTYLGAERNGPRLAQEDFSDEAAADRLLGIKGEFIAEVLLNRERKKIRSELVYPFRETSKGVDALLLQATQDWMSSIVGAIEIQPSENGNAPPSLNFKRPGLYSEWVTSTNTGFGISYTLPIVVAGLLATQGGFLIIDSPEAHLHPAAQTALAKFLAWVASAGVNVIIETHSDHILDGIRLATLTNGLRLKPHNCSILNINRDEDDNPRIDVIQISESGSLSQWPRGFFDQQAKNLRGIADAVRIKNAN